MLCYSTGSLPDAFSFSDIADLLNATPFKGVELVVTPAMLSRASDVAYWQGVSGDFAKLGLTFRNVHLGAPHLLGPEPHRPGLSSLDPVGRGRKSLAAEKAMAIAAALGSKHVTLTTGLPESAEFAREIFASPEPGENGGTSDPVKLTASDIQARQIKALKRVLADLIRKKPPQIKILIEQEPEHVIHSTDQLLDLAREFPGEIFVNFDVGHSEVLGEDIGACIKRLGPLLLNIHLEDIRGRVHAHKLYGEGDVDFDSIFQGLHAIGYRGDYTPDLYPFKDDYLRAIGASSAFLRHHGVLTKAL